MKPVQKKYFEIRCPVHGFVTINEWEREIISQPAFQRLRRIRQLAWTDYVYPGAMHTRFEHSLGVMHVATTMYDALVRSSRTILENEMGFDDQGLNRDRILVRLAALLHDVGHTPFSHAAEELFPVVPEGGRRYEHEDYSAAIIRTRLKDVIENHEFNENYEITADKIAALLEGSPDCGRALIWRDLVTGQMDADRIDYLIRDSLHVGVQYGRFDWRRLIGCLVFVRSEEGRGIRLGVTEGGLHAAEALLLARYFMFTQVYFHKTRVAFNHHLVQALKEMLPNAEFPSPDGEQLDEYLKWDDWRVLGRLSDGQGGEHGTRLATRNHFREVYHTPENPKKSDLDRFDEICDALGNLVQTVESAEKSWYKVGETDIPIQSDNPGNQILPLSDHSDVIAGMKPIGKRMVFCRPEDKQAAKEVVSNAKGNES